MAEGSMADGIPFSEESPNIDDGPNIFLLVRIFFKMSPFV